jgi:hydrogenase-1 operon protein HyaF
MEMPKGMRTYAMPEMPEADEAQIYRAALAKLHEVLAALRAAPPAGHTIEIELTPLDTPNREFISQLLGEGEVSIIAGANIQAQEAVLAGVWRLQEVDAAGKLVSDKIEVGEFPKAVLQLAEEAAVTDLSSIDAGSALNLMNAAPLISELTHKVASYAPEAASHVINLSLLPLADADLIFLERMLGHGPVTVLSRGYGNCRISSTEVKNAWWVRYFNSREAIILNTIEVVRIPGVALAASQDLEDSAERLAEILEVYA